MEIVVLATTERNNKIFQTILVVRFIVISPLPTIIARRQINAYSSVFNRSCMDFAIFLTMGIVVSSFALPIILARPSSPVIDLEACYLTLAGNIVIYVTYLGFFLTLFQDDGSYTWGI
ncbi:hypothetical protein PGB90_000041 [Kerria lacca]